MFDRHRNDPENSTADDLTLLVRLDNGALDAKLIQLTDLAFREVINLWRMRALRLLLSLGFCSSNCLPRIRASTTT